VQRADLTTRAIAGFVDILLVVGLARLPDFFGFLCASGYILIRDGLFDHQSIGKKFIGLRVISSENSGYSTGYRESIIRNAPLALAFALFQIPYVGWVFGSVALSVEYLAALGDNTGMRIGDLLARTCVVPQAEASGAAKKNSDQPAEAIKPSDSLP
jgi:uncharacterized RDD family membrane protein YckC